MRKLSKRDLEIVELLAQGMSPKRYCGEIVYNNRVAVSTFGEHPEEIRRAQQL